MTNDSVYALLIEAARTHAGRVACYNNLGFCFDAEFSFRNNTL